MRDDPRIARYPVTRVRLGARASHAARDRHPPARLHIAELRRLGHAHGVLGRLGRLARLAPLDEFAGELPTQGGVLIFTHPLYNRWNTEHHPSYVEFFERVLPETGAQLARIQAGAGAVMELPDAAF